MDFRLESLRPDIANHLPRLAKAGRTLGTTRSGAIRASHIWRRWRSGSCPGQGRLTAAGEGIYAGGAAWFWRYSRQRRAAGAPLAVRGGGGEPSCRSVACRRGPGRHDAAGFGRWARRARRCQAHLKEAPQCCGCGRAERERRDEAVILPHFEPETCISTFWT